MAKKVNKTNFLERLEGVEQEALDFIRKTLKKGQTITLATNNELEKNNDLIYELPNVGHYGKHGTYDEYAVLSITKSTKNVITLQTKGKGEADGEEEFGLGEMDANALCFLADEISKKLK